jgi:hypothetical protein
VDTIKACARLNLKDQDGDSRTYMALRGPGSGPWFYPRSHVFLARPTPLARKAPPWLPRIARPIEHTAEEAGLPLALAMKASIHKGRVLVSGG